MPDSRERAAGLRKLGYGGPLHEVSAVEWRDGSATPVEGRIVEETPVVLVYNHVPHVVMMATPEDLEDFAVGFSVTEELVASPDELLDVAVERMSLEALRDMAADHQDEALEGAHNADLQLIGILRTLSRSRQWRVLGHEMAHALIDRLDRT